MRLLPLLLLLAQLPAQSIQIAPDHYFIDHDLGLVLVNQAVTEVNDQISGTVETLLLDQAYDLGQPQDELAVGTPYTLNIQGQSYQLYLTDLPVIHLSASGPVVDEPAVLSTFTLSAPNQPSFTSLAGLEIRGGFSQNYPKKSYRLELWEDGNGDENRHEALLGMRSDDDWNLSANYNEPLRLRNHLSWQIWEEWHQLYYQQEAPEARAGIRAEFVEVFLDNQYRGLYQLTERMDRKQLGLEKLDESGDLRGLLYKGVAHGNTNFTSLPDLPATGEERWGAWEIKYPDPVEGVFAPIHAFTGFVLQSSNAEFLETVETYFDLQSALDYYLFINLLRAYDNMGKNSFLARRDVGDPFVYAPWDLDGVFGTNWQGIYSSSSDNLLNNRFFERLLEDCTNEVFRGQLQARWNQLRESGLVTPENIFARFELVFNRLEANGAYAREAMAWSEFSPSGNEMNQLLSFLEDRIDWLDENLLSDCVSATREPLQRFDLYIYPNPTTDQRIYLGGVAAERIDSYELYRLNGQLVESRGSTATGQFSHIDLPNLPSGVYLLRFVGREGEVIVRRLLI